MQVLSFFADDKFDVVIAELEGRGWRRLRPPSASPSASRGEFGCDLLWTNLKSLDWSSLSPTQLVNHLRGSQHLSNKAFLAYHIDTSGYADDMPLQWSAAYQDLAVLIGLATLNALFALAAGIVQEAVEREKELDAAARDDQGFREVSSVINVLNMDAEWSRSADALIIKELLPMLQRFRHSLLNRRTTDPSIDREREDSQSALQALLQRIISQRPYLKWAGRNNVWIVKPVGQACGANIKVVQGLLPLLRLVKTEMAYKCVVQKYIERPLLVKDGRKFDIRQWLLVTSVDPLVVWGFSEFYCRLSARRFGLSPAELSDRMIHLCNHAVQKGESVEGAADGESGEAICDTMLTHAQFDAELRHRIKDGCLDGRLDLGGPGAVEFRSSADALNAYSVVDAVLMPQIKRVAVRTVASVRDKLEKIGGGFEWLGLDLMVTDDLQVLLIECNVSPDVSRSTAVTSRVVEAAVKDGLGLLIDRQVAAASSVHAPASVFDATVSPQPAPTTSSSAPTWQLWYPPAPPSPAQTSSSSLSSEAAAAALPVTPVTPEPPLTFSSNYLSFARSKRERCLLGKDYSPRKEALCDRALQVLTGGMGGTASGDEGAGGFSLEEDEEM